MKSVSASIVVLAGVACFTAGGFIGHGDTQAFVMFVGGAVAAIGLTGWVVTVRGNRPPSAAFAGLIEETGRASDAEPSPKEVAARHKDLLSEAAHVLHVYGEDDLSARCQAASEGPA